MFDYSCMFRYGDKNIGSSGLMYFQTIEHFEAWFHSNTQIRWAILVLSETGKAVSTLRRPASFKFGK